MGVAAKIEAASQSSHFVSEIRGVDECDPERPAIKLTRAWARQGRNKPRRGFGVEAIRIVDAKQLDPIKTAFDLDLLVGKDAYADTLLDGLEHFMRIVIAKDGEDTIPGDDLIDHPRHEIQYPVLSKAADLIGAIITRKNAKIDLYTRDRLADRIRDSFGRVEMGIGDLKNPVAVKGRRQAIAYQLDLSSADVDRGSRHRRQQSRDGQPESHKLTATLQQGKPPAEAAPARGTEFAASLDTGALAAPFRPMHAVRRLPTPRVGERQDMRLGCLCRRFGFDLTSVEHCALQGSWLPRPSGTIDQPWKIRKGPIVRPIPGGRIMVANRRPSEGISIGAECAGEKCPNP